jgi:SseB protein N-terminal domain
MVPTDRPAPGSHDRGTPTGSLEVSAAALFETMLAARAAEARGDADQRALHEFYRTLMTGTLLLPVPPEHGEDAKAALASAVNDDEEVEVSVMLARDPDGSPVSVVFGSVAALAAWAPSGTGNLPLPARIAIANLAAAAMPAVMDPAGPVPYRFEADELASLAAGHLPGSGAPLFGSTARGSIVIRPAPHAAELEAGLSRALSATAVEAAYLVEADGDDGPRLLLGLVADDEASATVDVPDGTEVAWLGEPLLSQVMAVAAPFYRRGRR